MRFSSLDLRYLEGLEFSNGAVISVAEAGRSRDRVSLLSALAEGRRVVHVGCADHLPLIQRKMDEGTWLHGRLTEAASECLGLDINREALTAIQEKFGFTNVVCGDLMGPPIPDIMRQDWDLMILGEIVEHLDEPVSFLRAIYEKYSEKVSRLALSVPNATSMQNIGFAWRGRECINTDHRFWFTPYTLAKVAVRAGWRPGDFWYCMGAKHGRNPLRRWCLERYPAFRDTLVMVLER